MRIVIGEDSVLFREGLARLLADAGHEIVAKADDAPRSVDAVAAHGPDLAIIDIRMPPDLTDDGARAARTIRAATRGWHRAALPAHRDPALGRAGGGGRFGYLLKDRVLDVDDFLDALRGSPRAGRRSTPRWSPG